MPPRIPQSLIPAQRIQLTKLPPTHHPTRQRLLHGDRADPRDAVFHKAKERSVVISQPLQRPRVLSVRPVLREGGPLQIRGVEDLGLALGRQTLPKPGRGACACREAAAAASAAASEAVCWIRGSRDGRDGGWDVGRCIARSRAWEGICSYLYADQSAAWDPEAAPHQLSMRSGSGRDPRRSGRHRPAGDDPSP